MVREEHEPGRRAVEHAAQVAGGRGRQQRRRAVGLHDAGEEEAAEGQCDAEDEHPPPAGRDRRRSREAPVVGPPGPEPGAEPAGGLRRSPR